MNMRTTVPRATYFKLGGPARETLKNFVQDVGSGGTRVKELAQAA